MRAKRTQKILLIALALIPVLVYWAGYINQRRDVTRADCPEEVVHDIYGTEYIVSVCRLAFSEPYILKRLRIYSKDRELLAERFPSQDWEEKGNGYGLEKDGKSIAYYTGDEQKSRHIQLPPNRMDWLRARLP